MNLPVDFSDPLLIVILGISVLIIIVAVVATIVNFIVYWRYYKYNKQNSASLTGYEAARSMLDSLGMTDYNVAKCGFIRMLFLGNSYSPGKKTIFLRGSIFNRTSVTAVAMACQKAGLAVLHRNNDKQFLSRYKLMFITIIGPTALFPLLLIGLALDLIVFLSGSFTFTLIALLLGLALFVCSAVFTYLQIPVEKNAVKIAENTLITYNVLNPEQLEKVRKIYDVYILNFILTFILEMLQIVKLILQIIYIFARKN